MDNLLQDLEAGVPSNTPRQSNKKMRKRKQLDSLLKFRVTKKHSNDLLRSSEDELFLPQRRPSMTKHAFPRYNYCKYSQCILSTLLISVFVAACIALIYSNIALKRDVQDLSLRIDDMERRYSKIEFTRVISTVEQMKVRLNLLERWNLSLIYNQLQKLQTRMLLNDVDVIASNNHHVQPQPALSPDIGKTFDIKDESLHPLMEMMTNESASEWHAQLNSVRNDIRNLNRSDQLQGLVRHLDQVTDWMNNTSEKTSLILTKLQSNLNQLREKIDQCACAKAIESSSTARTSEASQQTKTENDDVEQIVN